MTLATRAGMDFISALDRGRLGALRRLCAPGATWWVDTGPDRVSGDAGSGPPGPERFPLHGTLEIERKIQLMVERGPDAFPAGIRQIPRRVIAGERDCVIEVEGHGVHASGAVYANRYGFVFDVDGDGLIVRVREYLDTIHAQRVLGVEGGLPPRTTVPAGDSRSPLIPPADPPPGVASALALWPALASGDVDGFAALFAEGAAFWTDSGSDRERGRLDGWGDVRANGPFHGRVPVADKLAVIRERLASSAYRSPGVEVTPHRLIADGTLIAIEASGEAALGDLRYQNRYLWIIEAGPSGIAEVREYCDTLPIAELMGYPAEFDA